jgi:hypothetical protein
MDCVLEAVSYRLVTPDAFVSVEFDEGDNPWSGTVIVRFAQQVVWRDRSVIDLVVENSPEDALEAKRETGAGL